VDIEAQIQGLLKEGEPLRLLDDDDPKKVPLTAIVDKINELRAQQEKAGRITPEAPQSYEEERAEGKTKIALANEAKSLGITIDGRWSVKRLEDAIAEARSHHDTVVDGLIEGQDRA
jgi:hypothetical protein